MKEPGNLGQVGAAVGKRKVEDPGLVQGSQGGPVVAEGLLQQSGGPSHKRWLPGQQDLRHIRGMLFGGHRSAHLSPHLQLILFQSRSVSVEKCRDSWQPVTCSLRVGLEGLAQEGVACLGDVREHFCGRNLSVGPWQRLQGVATLVACRLQPDQAEQDVQAGPPGLEGSTPTCATIGAAISPCDTTTSNLQRDSWLRRPQDTAHGSF